MKLNKTLHIYQMGIFEECSKVQIYVDSLLPSNEAIYVFQYLNILESQMLLSFSIQTQGVYRLQTLQRFGLLHELNCTRTCSISFE